MDYSAEGENEQLLKKGQIAMTIFNGKTKHSLLHQELRFGALVESFFPIPLTPPCVRQQMAQLGLFATIYLPPLTAAPGFEPMLRQSMALHRTVTFEGPSTD